MKRREDIDNFDVYFMYEVEGMTQRAIAEYYKVPPSTIRSRLHPEKNKKNNQTENSKEAKKRWRGSEEGKAYMKEYQKEYGHTEKRKEYVKEWRNSEAGKEWTKKWKESDNGRNYLKIWRQTDKGKDSMKRDNSLRRQLGFIPINKPFDGSEAHHIDEEHVINIPVASHRSIWHNVRTGQGMQEINAIAFEYITEEVFDKLIARVI